ncbi:Uncaracterized surface protein containing fasciclin (FAS1) repeats [Nonlabens sp. Hel1_33_55]|uniref:fasciclin domain-containing protein n=1 Tax=Nonlabens sp. Hel1_33_55 TaxID=1336802 RepID=UPI000875DC71|nr:fasciclin domain-containing protein [Nonlabens sp. Hel1_33_55]SCY17434.1 Uncaracterized surface protein containing fasciclin (FAS1) repeats [Nonlabens sp. Hel1_33_55]
MKRFLNKVLFLVLLVVSISCVDDDDNMNVINGPTALDFIMESPDHTLMVQALERSQLDFTLDQDGSLTVFAPNNQAFSTFLSANNFGSIDAIPEDLLRTLLLYHVQTEIKTVGQFNSQYFKTLAQIDNAQMDVFVELENSNLRINDEATVIDPDNTVSNGIVHIIDNVLDLPSVFTLISANPNFSNLTTALTQEGLSITLDDNTDASAPFTLFAPSNPAFASFIAADPNDEFENVQDVLDQNNLDDQLLYHVLGNQALRQDAFVDGSTINPLGNGTFTVGTMSGISILDGSGMTVNLVATNITAFNGVIHTLDFILQQQ